MRFSTVLDGSVIRGLNDGTPVTLSPGQTFYEGPNDIHTISRNASKTQLYTSQNLAIELDGPVNVSKIRLYKCEEFS